MGDAKRRQDRLEAIRLERRHRWEVLQRARRATVGFGFERPKQRPVVIGSGVIVDPLGIIITARHVVLDLEAMVLKEKRMRQQVRPVIFIPGDAQVEMKMNDDGSEGGEVLDQRYLMTPPRDALINGAWDLAVVGIQQNEVELTALPINADLAPHGGDPVATCGWPYGLELHQGQAMISSFLFGHVSAVVPHPDLGAKHRRHYLMELPVNPGNSGGPVFDPDSGEVFGIVSRRYEPRGIPSGLSVVEPVVQVLGAVEALRKKLTGGNGST